MARTRGRPAGRPRLVAYVVPGRARRASAASGQGRRHVEQWRDALRRRPTRDAPAARRPTRLQHPGAGTAATPASRSRRGDARVAGRHRRADPARAAAPRAVLEIGCGTGLLLFRVAPTRERYRGTDFSAVALAHVDAPSWPARACRRSSCSSGAADDWTALPAGAFDLVVLNSVVAVLPRASTTWCGCWRARSRRWRPAARSSSATCAACRCSAAFHASVELQPRRGLAAGGRAAPAGAAATARRGGAGGRSRPLPALAGRLPAVAPGRGAAQARPRHATS